MIRRGNGKDVVREREEERRPEKRERNEPERSDGEEIGDHDTPQDNVEDAHKTCVEADVREKRGYGRRRREQRCVREGAVQRVGRVEREKERDEGTASGIAREEE